MNIPQLAQRMMLANILLNRKQQPTLVPGLAEVQEPPMGGQTQEKAKYRTYGQEDPKSLIARSMLDQGTQMGPVSDWTGGLNRVAQALIAGKAIQKFGLFGLK